MAVVKTTIMSESEIIKIIEGINDDDFYFLRSKIDSVELDRGKEKLIQKGLWEAGRLFNEEYELRWRLAGEGYRLTLLTETEKLPPVLTKIDYRYTDNSWDTDNTQIFLWGTYRRYSDKFRGFIQVQIPKILEYPAPKSQHWNEKDGALIYGVNYLKDGITLFTRFREVAK